MNQIVFENGIEEFQLQGGGVLRFNPSDPNLYARFLEAEEELKALEAALNRQAEALTEEGKERAIVQLTAQADQQVKKLLNKVFGGENDFDKALGGVSLLAMTGNGQPVVSNLFTALEEILSRGAARFAREKAESIRAQR